MPFKIKKLPFLLILSVLFFVTSQFELEKLSMKNFWMSDVWDKPLSDEKGAKIIQGADSINGGEEEKSLENFLKSSGWQEIHPERKHEHRYENMEEIHPERKSEDSYGNMEEIHPERKSEHRYESMEEIHPERKHEHRYENMVEIHPERKSEDSYGNMEEIHPERKSEHRYESMEEIHPKRKHEHRYENMEEIHPEQKSEDSYGNMEEIHPERKSEHRYESMEEIHPKRKHEHRYVNMEENHPEQKSEDSYGNMEEIHPERKHEHRYENMEEIHPDRKHEHRYENMEEIHSEEKSGNSYENMEKNHSKQKPGHSYENMEGIHSMRKPIDEKENLDKIHYGIELEHHISLDNSNHQMKESRGQNSADIKPPTIVTEAHWVAWSPWSHCTTSCDIGIQYRKRKCFPKNRKCQSDQGEKRICIDKMCNQGDKKSTLKILQGGDAKLKCYGWNIPKKDLGLVWITPYGKVIGSSNKTRSRFHTEGDILHINPAQKTDNGLYHCTWPPYKTGTGMSLKVETCESLPCKNNGNCMESFIDHSLLKKTTCVCTRKYHGARCERVKSTRRKTGIIFIVIVVCTLMLTIIFLCCCIRRRKMKEEPKKEIVELYLDFDHQPATHSVKHTEYKYQAKKYSVAEFNNKDARR